MVFLLCMEKRTDKTIGRNIFHEIKSCSPSYSLNVKKKLALPKIVVFRTLIFNAMKNILC